jgi:anti-sigma28 factor (negative regulator of flagellin synthesis)
MERVHELRQRIAAGNYAAPAEMLAARVIDAAMGMENDEAA